MAESAVGTSTVLDNRPSHLSELGRGQDAAARLRAGRAAEGYYESISSSELAHRSQAEIARNACQRAQRLARVRTERDDDRCR